MVEDRGLEPPEHQEAKYTHRQAFVVLAPKRVQAAIVGIWEPRAQNKIPKPGKTMIGREGCVCVCACVCVYKIIPSTSFSS